MTWTTITSFSSGTALSAADLNTMVKGNLDHLYDNLPTRATLWHDEATVTAGNALTRTIAASQAYGWFAYQNAAADADSFTYTLVLAAGTYTMYVLGKTNSSYGKLDWDLDGTTITTGQDWYAAETFNVTKTVASIVVTTGGRLVLTGTVNGKNAGSTNYNIGLTKIWFKQASDS